MYRVSPSSPVRTVCLLIVLALSSGCAAADTKRPVVDIGAATDIQGRLSALAALSYNASDFEDRVADGRLATLYAQLINQQQWAQSLQPFVTDKALPVAAATHLQQLSTDIKSFYQRYTGQSHLGDATAYERPDVIVILGSNRPVLEQRLAVALPLIQKYPAAAVVLSGGGRTLELEAGIMREFLLAKGVDAHRLIMETDSLDTVGNAVFTGLALKEHSVTGNRVLLVTSDFHAPRSLFLYRKILDPRYRVAVALAPYEGNDATARIDSELRQQATTIDELLRWGALPGQGEASDLHVNGVCDVFFQMLLRHKLYASRWDLPRRYADTCNLKGVL